jgi:hypothetical protein
MVGRGPRREGGAEAGASVPAPVAPSSPASRAGRGRAGRAGQAVHPAAAPPPRPDPPYVAAAKARTKIPWWAMPVVGLLPLWVLLYAWALKPSEKVVAGPLGEGKTVFATCASCHGSTGGGGGRPPAQQRRGPEDLPEVRGPGVARVHGQRSLRGQGSTGDPNRPGGPHQGGSFNGSFMPQQGAKYGGAPDRRGDHRRRLPRALHDRPAPTRSTRSSCRSSPTGARRGAPSTRPVCAGGQDARRRGHQHDAQGLSSRCRAPARTRSSSSAPGPGRSRPAAYWLARHGHDVAVVERKSFPREKTCGDGLTPARREAAAGHGPRRRARPVPPLRRAALHRAGPALELAWPSTRVPAATATSCGAATSTGWWP